MFDRPCITSRLVAQTAPGLPVDRYVIGKPVEEVLCLLPRLFNLCRGAQSAAVRAAIGLSVERDYIANDILRDHLVKLYVTWPGFLDMPPSALPEDWSGGGEALLRAVFGAAHAPRTPQEFTIFLRNETASARALKQIARRFGAGDAVADGLPSATHETIWAGTPMDNSPATRQAAHPVMQDIEARLGRGPLWRAAARLFDLEAAALGRLPEIQCANGAAMVPAARGAYAVYLETADGRVSAFRRVTPTDALVAREGVLDRSLATLPEAKFGLGPLLLDILDPCCPVRLREVAHA